MARKRKTKPNRVCIYFDQLICDLDFMSNECAGIILKMIVWYADGSSESKEKIAEMEKYINTLPDKSWVTAMCNRMYKCIDEDLAAYKDTCEQRHKAALKREADKKEQEGTTGHNCAPNTTTVHNGAQQGTKCTNPIQSNPIQSNPILSNDNSKDNIYIPSTHEKSGDEIFLKELSESDEYQSWRERVCMNHHLSIEELRDKLIEFNSLVNMRMETHTDIKDYAGHFINILNNKQEANGKKQPTTYLSRDEQRKVDENARRSAVANRISERIAEREAKKRGIVEEV